MPCVPVLVPVPVRVSVSVSEHMLAGDVHVPEDCPEERRGMGWCAFGATATSVLQRVLVCVCGGWGRHMARVHMSRHEHEVSLCRVIWRVDVCPREIYGVCCLGVWAWIFVLVRWSS